jgi:hypothetical protein
MSKVTLSDLQARHDMARSAALARAAFERAVNDEAKLLRFFGNYTSFNATFGSSVAGLASELGRSRQLFLDPDEPLTVLADRSVHVASFFFDAARDEFDDRSTEHRDTHRCLAQAFVVGLARCLKLDDPAQANALLEDPPWLIRLQQRVVRGYGIGLAGDAEGLYEAMGFHLGSEVLADQEFSMLDELLRAVRPELVVGLEQCKVRVADEEHGAYVWLGMHSGHGGGVELDHFGWAVQGVEAGLRYAVGDRERMRAAVLRGFDRFAVVHSDFFSAV